jgi:hypothetical protein
MFFKNGKTDKKKQEKLFVIVSAVAGLALALLLVTGYFAFTAKQKEINKLVGENFRLDVLVNHMDNQACRGLDAAIPKLSELNFGGLRASQQMLPADTDGKFLTYRCSIGLNTKQAVAGKDVAEVDSQGYEMGAEVSYFTSAEKAEAFASSRLNPQRYWTVPNDALNEQVGMWHYFTSYILSASPVYFDSYAVRGNAVVRLSLPCASDKATADTPEVQKCLGPSADEGVAIESLDSFTTEIAEINY